MFEAGKASTTHETCRARRVIFKERPKTVKVPE